MAVKKTTRKKSTKKVAKKATKKAAVKKISKTKAKSKTAKKVVPKTTRKATTKKATVKKATKNVSQKATKKDKSLSPQALATLDLIGVPCYIYDDVVISESSSDARLLHERSLYGTLLKDGRVQFTLIEAYYLHEHSKISVIKGKKVQTIDELRQFCIRKEKSFLVRHAVYRDFRERGYIIKTALKFGADFRVYEKGIKPGEDHARWIVYPVPETSNFTWYEFAAKNRVAHSTKKRLLLGVVDEEESVTYYEIKWVKP